MRSHKHHEHLEHIKDRITTSTSLDESEKNESMKRVEEWVLEDKAFGVLQEKLLEISVFFEGVFSELGIK